MKKRKGAFISTTGAVAALVFFLFGPWLLHNTGSLGLAFSTGVELAIQGKQHLYIIPGTAIVALVLMLCERKGLFGTQVVGAGLVATVVCMIPLVYFFPNLAEPPAPSQDAYVGWGFWTTAVSLALIPLGGIIWLIETEESDESK